VGGGRLGVQVWEFPRQTPVSAPSISAENIILDVALSADGRWLYVTSQFQTGDMVGSTTLHLWNLEQPQDSTTLDTGWAAGPISLSPDGRWLALSTNINDISVYDRQQDQWRTFSGYSTPTTRLFFKADELYLYTDGSLVVVALDTLEMVGRGIFNDLFSVKAVVWADPWFATIGEEGFDHPNTLRLWNWQTAETLDIQFEMALPLTLVEASGQFPDGGLIWQSYDPLEYANISGSQLQITATGQKLDTPYRITYAAFTPDQSRIAVGTEYSQIYWLDATTLEEITIWQLYEGKILLIEFSPDGQEIRIGGSHGLIKTWLIE
jgi:WD40 repeat protein